MYAIHNTRTNSDMWLVQYREGAIKRAVQYATSHRVTIEIRRNARLIATVLGDGTIVEAAQV